MRLEGFASQFLTNLMPDAVGGVLQTGQAALSSFASGENPFSAAYETGKAFLSETLNPKYLFNQALYAMPTLFSENAPPPGAAEAAFTATA